MYISTVLNEKLESSSISFVLNVRLTRPKQQPFIFCKEKYLPSMSEKIDTTVRTTNTLVRRNNARRLNAQQFCTVNNTFLWHPNFSTIQFTAFMRNNTPSLYQYILSGIAPGVSTS